MVIHVAVLCAAILAYALLARTFDRLSVTPHIIVLLAGLGVGLLGVRELTADAEGLRVIGEFALVLILYTDATRIDISSLEGSAQIPARLLLVGLPLTILLGVAAALVLFPSLDVWQAVLLAVLVAPTDAGLGTVVVTSPLVPKAVRQGLNVESGLNDGIVTPLVILVAGLAGAAGAGLGEASVQPLREIVMGALAGAGIGLAAGWLLAWAERAGGLLDHVRWMTGPVIAGAAWATAEVLGGNVFVAAFVAGVATVVAHGSMEPAFTRLAEGVGEFAGLAVFYFFGVLFVSLPGVGFASVVFALAALTVVRMLPVALSLAGTGASRFSAGFMGWFGPRGLASIVLALLATGSGEVPGGGVFVRAAVAVTVLVSVFAHGLSAGPLASAYSRYCERSPDSLCEHEPAAQLRSRGVPRV